METKGLAVALAFFVAFPVFAQETPPIPSADSICSEPDKAVEGCKRAEKLYYRSKRCDKAAKKCYVDLQAAEEKLAKAEAALAKKTESPDPGGWVLSPELVIGGVTVSLGLGALVYFLIDEAVRDHK